MSWSERWTFDGYPNRLGTPKLLLEDDAVRRFRVGGPRYPVRAAPGTVLAQVDAAVTVATATNDVVLEGLRTLEGRSLSGDELADRYAIQPGRRLPEPVADDLDRLTALTPTARNNEEFWVWKLDGLPVLELPGLRPAEGTEAGEGHSHKSTQKLTRDALAGLAQTSGGRPDADAVTAALVVSWRAPRGSPKSPSRTASGQ